MLSIVYILLLSNSSLRFEFEKVYYGILNILFGLSWIFYPVIVIIQGKMADVLHLDAKRLYYYFIVILLVLAAFIIPTIISNIKNEFEVSRPLYGITVYVIMMIGISMLYNFMLRLLINQTKHQNMVPLIKTVKFESTASYPMKINSTIKSTALKDKIQLYLEDKKYLDPEFNINTMAKDLKISRTEISKFFKENFNQNVLKTINSLRIEEVCKYLNNPEFNLSIDELAFRCGFSSRASFYRNFSLDKNCTPIEYRQKCLRNK